MGLRLSPPGEGQWLHHDEMREKRKDGMLSYGFLLDRDVSKAASLFPKKRTKTIADIGLPQNATDTEIVKAAWERQLTIVTGNGDDFVREITRFLAQTKKAFDGCHEVFGLIVLPNGYERQRRILQNIEQTLRLGKEAITWTDVAYRNWSRPGSTTDREPSARTFSLNSPRALGH